MHPIEAGHALGGEQQIKNESEIDDLFTTVNVTLAGKFSKTPATNETSDETR